MNQKNVHRSLENRILLITINRPDNLNALNLETLSELEHAVREVYSNNDISGAIITGTGNKAFVAGADIKEFANYTKTQGRKMAENGQRIFKLVEECPKPIIAAVNGYALGGGCELAMACHLRIAAPNAKFGQPEVKLGIIPGYGGTQRLLQILGKTHAMKLLLTGGTIDAMEAKNYGLLTDIVPAENLISACESLLKKIMENSPLAIKSTINSVNAFYSHNVDGFKKEIEEFEICFGSNDFKEGTTAFLSKRKPDFFEKK